MKNILAFLLLIFSFFGTQNSFAQIEAPVTWTHSLKDKGNLEYELIMTAKMEPKWHLYSQNLENDEGPIATTFTYEETPTYNVIGKTNEPKPKTEYDENFGMNIAYFSEQVVFTQKIKLAQAGTFDVKAEVEFMVCNDVKCLPPEIEEFTFTVKGKEVVKLIEPTSNSFSQIETPVKWNSSVKQLNDSEFELIMTANIENKWHLYSQNLESKDGPIATTFTFTESNNYVLIGETKEPKPEKEYDDSFNMNVAYFTDKVVFTQKIKLIKTGITKITAEVEFMVCNNVKCLPPETEELTFEIEGKGEKITVSPLVDKENSSSSKKSEHKGLWTIFFLAFLSGFAALLTPCVFPMIPMTVSFFTKQSDNKAKGIRNAILYGISIISIYVLLGTVVTWLFGSDALNALATNVYFNIFFFLMLVFFAISFLGAFEITLPNSWVNSSVKGEDKAGFIGIFFMAFTLALVSFSCTGPIVGTLLVQAANIGGVGPVVGMLGFSLALALPFTLFAAFPGWMNSLPKSGGWLNTVKVFLGFLELALAFKFLSNADLVVNTHYLEREVFLAIWIGIFTVLAMYLFGFIRLPHDSPMEFLSVGRTLLATITIIFVIYLIPGMWGAPLKLISGFPPPMTYSESPKGVGKSGGESSAAIPEHAHVGAQGIPTFDDLEHGLAYAKKTGKSAFLDFTGKACVNCRKMEEKVWGEPGIIEKLRNEVVIISLYVDDKRKLPENEQIEVTIGNKIKKLKTIGNKWSYYQAVHYKTNTQPYYVMLDVNGNDLANGSADYEHHGNTEDFKKWLESGLDLFKKSKK